jgi:hypothetical protein
MARSPGCLGLFWCTTPDHDQDWFVVARDEAEASRFHEAVEGYGAGDAGAELVLELPDDLGGAGTAPGWPTRELLVACGAEILSEPDAGPRVVRLGDRVFVEGDLARNAAARAGAGEQN